MATPEFTIGIEEEYLLVDRDSLALVEVPDDMMADCKQALADQVSPEYMQCQIEIGTGVCEDVGQARDDLRHLRRTIADCAARHNAAPIAASCHPFADWKNQHHTDKERYNRIRQDLGGVMRRMLICGMHVHVGLNDDPLRADLLRQLSYFLPHLLALSTSSPFWQGEDTGLSSYRLSVFDNLPRTGLPPQLSSWDEYERSVKALVDLGLIEDSTKIWWDLRPSHSFPTLETRICDVCPRMEDTLAVAAVIQCLHRMLWRLRTRNQRWRIYDRFLISENRWRAQRYGIEEGLIDFGRGEIVPMDELTNELIGLLHEDAEALNCVEELMHLRTILDRGTSAMRQRAVRVAAEAAGADHDTQMRAVVSHLIEDFQADL
ncbi:MULTISPECIES: carboxylate-amine ligase [Marinovum]|uniref:carboxylate-amine ligase n=1 Tax=Marinovum TaxID=367771 RepID=UPI00065B2C78|nr:MULTISPECIES: carboxylate-amine ligase [Marinovum]AKO97129.1 carboxylate-amine ligase, YbdK family [Marinovum algicola DG 898]MDD9739916.1 carboxylate-amine ligase [Marinovum sp. SP66]MDD9742507.1 carboxylate-amine ligase [Marinovum sp. PR37]